MNPWCQSEEGEKLTYLSSLETDSLSAGCYLHVDCVHYCRICSCWWQRKANICRNDLPDFNGNSSQSSCLFYATDRWTASIAHFFEGFTGNINKHMWLSDCNHHVTMNQSAGIISKVLFCFISFIYSCCFDPTAAKFRCNVYLRPDFGVKKTHFVLAALAGCCSVCACCCWQPRLWVTWMKPLWTTSGTSGSSHTGGNTTAWWVSAGRGFYNVEWNQKCLEVFKGAWRKKWAGSAS